MLSISSSSNNLFESSKNKMNKEERLRIRVKSVNQKQKRGSKLWELLYKKITFSQLVRERIFYQLDNPFLSFKYSIFEMDAPYDRYISSYGISVGYNILTFKNFFHSYLLNKIPSCLEFFKLSLHVAWFGMFEYHTHNPVVRINPIRPYTRQHKGIPIAVGISIKKTLFAYSVLQQVDMLSGGIFSIYIDSGLWRYTSYLGDEICVNYFNLFDINFTVRYAFISFDLLNVKYYFGGTESRDLSERLVIGHVLKNTLSLFGSFNIHIALNGYYTEIKKFFLDARKIKDQIKTS